MVRTLDFHSKNVGSIPASLTIKNTDYIKIKKLKTSKLKKSLISTNYSLNFISLLSPSTVKNIRLILTTEKFSKKNKKILIKQSYMLLTWLFYLDNQSLSKKTEKMPSFFIKPVRKSTFTLIKSPMAHKTFSQEQYQIKFFSIKISFYNNLNHTLSDFELNKSVLFALSLRQSMPFFETNFFFLKKFSFMFFFTSKKYLTY